MAVMVPAQVANEAGSDAERRVFRAAREQLSDKDWIALHSLGLTCHNRKPWAEIDFVLIGPAGVFCIEVKGGGVARAAGTWTSTDRFGHVHELKESPFSQAGSAAAALHHYLCAAAPVIRSSVTGYGVVFPDVRFAIRGPDVEPEVVCDVRDFPASFSKYVRRLAEYWRGRVRRDWARAVEPLLPRDREAVRDALARDFDLCPSLRSEVGSVNEQLVRLTEEQCRILGSLSENEKMFVAGGAGTGKTLLAVAEARRLAQQDRKVLYTCFNRRLAGYVGEILSRETSITVRNLHGLMADVVCEAGMERRLPDAQPEDLFGVIYPELCLEALIEREQPSYDVLIVDEAQDLLLEPYVDLFEALIEGGLGDGTWRMFLDPNQDIFGGSGTAALNRVLRFRPTRFRLSVNCRNTVPIATTTSLLSGVPLGPVLAAEGPKVETEWYDDDNAQRRRVSAAVRELLHKGLRPQEMIVLSPRRLQNSCLAEGLKSCPSTLVNIDDYRGPEDRAVRFSTIAAFKGLESDAVLLVDLEDLKERDSLGAVYVGASRARALLRVFICKTQRQAYRDLAYRFGASASSGMAPQ